MYSNRSADSIFRLRYCVVWPCSTAVQRHYVVYMHFAQGGWLCRYVISRARARPFGIGSSCIHTGISAYHFALQQRHDLVRLSRLNRLVVVPRVVVSSIPALSHQMAVSGADEAAQANMGADITTVTGHTKYANVCQAMASQQGVQQREARTHLAQCERTRCSTVTSCRFCLSPPPGRCSPAAESHVRSAPTKGIIVLASSASLCIEMTATWCGVGNCLQQIPVLVLVDIRQHRQPRQHSPKPVLLPNTIFVTNLQCLWTHATRVLS